MRFTILFFLLVFPSFVFSETKEVQIDGPTYKLNGLLTISENNPKKNIVLLVHGILGHQKMEIIDNAKTILHENNIDSLSINLSYGIPLRENGFFPCDKDHKHNESISIKEISYWHKFLINNNYKNIYLLGHSRGALNITQYYLQMNRPDIKGVFLIAPTSKNVNDYIKIYKEIYSVNLEIKMSEMLDRIKKKKEGYTKINFFHCEEAMVHDNTFLSYYQDNGKNLIDLLKTMPIPVFVFTASEDSIANLTFDKVKQLNHKTVKLTMIEGSGHMFRDLYLEEVMDTVLEIIQ